MILAILTTLFLFAVALRFWDYIEIEKDIPIIKDSYTRNKKGQFSKKAYVPVKKIERLIPIRDHTGIIGYIKL